MALIFSTIHLKQTLHVDIDRKNIINLAAALSSDIAIKSWKWDSSQCSKVPVNAKFALDVVHFMAKQDIFRIL